MLAFIARRLGLLIPTFFGVTLLTFALIRMIPGDPVEVMMGERRVDPVMHAAGHGAPGPEQTAVRPVFRLHRPAGPGRPG